MRTRFISNTLSFAGTALLLSGIYITMYHDWVPPVVWHEHAHTEEQEQHHTADDQRNVFLPLQHIFPRVIIEKVAFKNQASGDETAVQGCRSSGSVAEELHDLEEEIQKPERQAGLLDFLHPVLHRQFCFSAN